jgi:hypothetical protein
VGYEKDHMRELRRSRREKGECANGCGNMSGSYYLCPTCRERSQRTNRRFKAGIHKEERSPRRMNTWGAQTLNEPLFRAMVAKGYPPREIKVLDIFAKRVGRSRRAVQGWLYESRVPSPDLHKIIESNLGESIKDLFPQITYKKLPSNTETRSVSRGD